MKLETVSCGMATVSCLPEELALLADALDDYDPASREPIEGHWLELTQTLETAFRGLALLADAWANMIPREAKMLEWQRPPEEFRIRFTMPELKDFLADHSAATHSPADLGEANGAES